MKLIDDRQVKQVSALSTSIGSSANIPLDALFALIDSKMVNLASSQILTNKILGFLQTNVVTDSATTGSAATLAAGDILAGTVRLTNASLASVSGIPAGGTGQSISIENQTGSPIIINDNDVGASAANRIRTGTGAGLSMPANATFTFVYDTVLSRWMLTGVAASAPAAIVPNIQSFVLTNNFTFVVTSANATSGATYTNNGQTFTVVTTISGSTTLVSSGTGAPTSSGTLTKSSGTGDATIIFSSQSNVGTYTTPSGPAPLYLRVIVSGGGGGGGGDNVSAGTAVGVTGGNSTFGSSLLIANGGIRGVSGEDGGAGGATTVGIGATPIVNVTGGGGNAGFRNDGGNNLPGGPGGSNPLGGAGIGGENFGGPGSPNTGAGGGGAGAPGAAVYGGAGGGSGGYIDAIIPSPSSSYTFTVGIGGAGGVSGGNGGGRGGDGVVTVIAYYQ